MLSNGAYCSTPRPRPPANRRPSSQQNRRSVSLAAKPSANGNGNSDTQQELPELNLGPSSNYLAPPIDPRINHPDSIPPHMMRPRIQIDRDLDLDLPDDLTAALERTAFGFLTQSCNQPLETTLHQPKTGKAFTNLPRNPTLSRSLGFPQVKASDLEADGTYLKDAASFSSLKVPKAKSRSNLDGLFTPLNQTPERAMQNTPDPDSFELKPADLNLEVPLDGPDVSILSAAENHHGSNDQIDDGDGEHDCEAQNADTSLFDPEWVGNLHREELESMLMQANQIIKQRERELGIAAAIGKALLEKNISLRSKHTGLMTRIASSASLYDVDAMDSGISAPQDSNSHQFQQPCSPPTTDIDLSFQPHSTDPQVLSTPSEIRVQPDAGDAFFQPTLEYDQPIRPPVESLGSPLKPFARISRDADLLFSQPPSPSGSIASAHSRTCFDSPCGTVADQPGGHRRNRLRPSLLHIQTAETQRQLESLSEQNETLLQQLSELQTEADQTRREGGKKLKKLNQEIGGLKAELEAATKRNVELEKHSPSSDVDGDDNNSDGTAKRGKKPWRRRGGVGPTSMWTHGLGNSPDFRSVLSPPRTNVVQVATPAQIAKLVLPAGEGAASLLQQITSGSLEPQTVANLVPSASTLEAVIAGQAAVSEGERALVIQLLAKIKELEETNLALARAGTEIDDKLGKAMEEGERLKDAYDAVELSNADNELGWWNVEQQQKEAETCNSEDGFREPLTISVEPIPSLMTPSGSANSLSDFGMSPSASSITFSATKRRAPGNRHVIESRRTIRAALHKERHEALTALDGTIDHNSSPIHMSRSGTEDSLISYTLDLSAESSVTCSPEVGKISKKPSSSYIGVGAAKRPSIRITPSIEDFGARRHWKEEVIAGGSDPSLKQGSRNDCEGFPSPPSEYSNKPLKDTLKPSDALQWISQQSKFKQPSLLTPHSNTFPNSSQGDPLPSSNESSPTKPIRSFQSGSLSRSSSFGELPRLPYNHLNITDSPMTKASLAYATDVNSVASNLYASGQYSSTTDLKLAPTRQRRTLGSELGSIFGGDDRKDDFCDETEDPSKQRWPPEEMNMAEGPPLWLSDLQTSPPRHSATRPFKIKPDRPTASYGRLVPEEEEEHRDDIECVLAQSVYNQPTALLHANSPFRKLDAALAANLAVENDGNWMADNDVVEKGGLKDFDQPRSDQFDLIGIAVERKPLQWADDDDFGRPITKSEAERIGLLQLSAASSSSRRPTARSLRGKTSAEGNSGQEADPTTPATATTKTNLLEIESEEQVRERLRLEALLRHRRIETLRQRGYEVVNSSFDLEEEAEVTARTFAVSPARHRIRAERALAARASGLFSAKRSKLNIDKPKRKDKDKRKMNSNWNPVISQGEEEEEEAGETSGSASSRCSMEQWLRDVHNEAQQRSNLPCSSKEETQTSSDESCDFELLDEIRIRKQGERGTDYFPISFRARYQPAMIKERVKVASNEMFSLMSTWITFTTVVMFAFVVAVRRGPSPVFSNSTSPSIVSVSVSARRTSTSGRRSRIV